MEKLLLPAASSSMPRLVVVWGGGTDLLANRTLNCVTGQDELLVGPWVASDAQPGVAASSF